MAFQSVEHLIDCAQHQPLWQAVLLDDCQDRDVTQEESFARMEALWQAMVESVENYDPQRRSASGLSGGQGEKMAQAQNTLCGPGMQQVIATALKVGEHNACMGRIVAAPTAGASGVMPAVLLPLWKREGLSTHTLVECLYVAAVFGQVIAPADGRRLRHGPAKRAGPGVRPGGRPGGGALCETQRHGRGQRHGLRRHGSGGHRGRHPLRPGH